MTKVPSYIFIVNPKSGSARHQILESEIGKFFRKEEYAVIYTKNSGHATEITNYYKNKEVKIIVAVGGDGTIHEIANGLLHSTIPLGIIPSGSGNGLARHLKIPLKISKALKLIQKEKTISIDIIKINDSFSCNTAGLGYDALITKHFGRNGKRGFSTYVFLAFSKFSRSTCFNADINKVKHENVWAVILANSDQMGNDAIIAPSASINDGLIDLVIVHKPKWWQIPKLFFEVFTRQLDRSSLVQVVKGSAFTISTDQPVHHQVDGEYQGKLQYLDARIQTNALRVICN